MNILIVSQYFWPENFRINDLAEGLVQRGHSVTVLTGRPNYPSGSLFDGYGTIFPFRESYADARVQRVPLFPRGSGKGLRLILNYASFAVSASLLGPLMAPQKTDVIIVFEPSPITVGLPAMVLKATTGAPVFFWLQDLWPESLSATGAVHSSVILKAVELMVRWLYKGCDRILVQSRAFVPAVLRLGGDKNNTYYFPNSAESVYRPVEVPANAPEQALMPEGFRITFAGNVGAAQDFDTIISAANLLKDRKDIHFIIIGDGRLMGHLKQSVQKLSLEENVHLLGRYPVERMPYFFSLSDALLVTLKNDPIFSLTIPSKVQSYLACGRPIIAALEGEGARIIELAKAGLTCRTQDPSKLADTVLSMYRLPRSVREEMGRKGRLLFLAEFERESLLDKLENWFSDVVEGNHAR